MSPRWYRIALADGDRVTLAAAAGEHLGAAIVAAAGRVGRERRVWPVAAAPLPAGEVPLGDSVGRGVVVGGTPPAGLGQFEFPSGIVPALGERARVAVAPGYARSVVGHTLVLEAVAAGDDVLERFYDVIEHLPAVDNVEVVVADHFEDAGREVWLTPRLRDVRRAVRFLDDFEDDLLKSGQVDVAIYLRAQRSTWKLTQHKTLVWLSEDAELTGKVEGWLTGAGLRAVDPLATVAAGPHFHYRGARSSARARLLKRMKSAGLARVDTQDAADAKGGDAKGGDTKGGDKKR